MRVFVYEHVTGGGMASQALPPRLAREADLMARSLVADLGDVPGVTVLASRDPRLAPLPGVESIPAEPGDAPLDLFARGLEAADAVWPTAPETGGLLEELARMTLAGNRLLLGCRPEAIRLASSKYRTAHALRGAGVPVVPTFRGGESLPPRVGAWIVKLDDGAGCEGARRVPDWETARRLLADASSGPVAQPWLEGEPSSLSLICCEGRARVLSVNRQRVRFDGEQPVLESLRINALPVQEQAHGLLAASIAAAVPGLWGCVGVDFISTPYSPVVLEINPRLTTSFSALRQATGLNAPAMVLAMLGGGGLSADPRPPIDIAVDIPLEAAGAR
ncbi:MAG: ATP-grasp domain-containing protein [Gemmatimonadota bacterium]|nr:ATP-grasp domain-containing protein [Gemmatimonadota bacterium]MDH4347269.1 ATP-grasp domain-containing protein [Gemmatimonadota bacterium]